jgi:hypothetical protein
VAEKMAAAEEVLGDYITAGEDAERLRLEVERAESRQADALARLAGLVGRAMAADMAEVDEAKVRSALAKKPTRASQPDTARDADAAAEGSSPSGPGPEPTSGEARSEPAGREPAVAAPGA